MYSNVALFSFEKVVSVQVLSDYYPGHNKAADYSQVSGLLLMISLQQISEHKQKTITAGLNVQTVVFNVAHTLEKYVIL